MCGRYVLVSKVEAVEKRFNVKAPQEVMASYHPHVNIGPGHRGMVITDQDPKQLQLFQFGYTPFWSKKRLYLFNARSEGDKNKENDPRYTGAKEIFKKPMFRHAIRGKRCLIIADAFLEGPQKEKLSKPYVVYLRDKNRPFAFAGIWDEWVDPSTGEIIQGHAIITTVSNGITQQIGHHRSPVILDHEQESLWLDTDTALSDVLSVLNPYPAEFMNAYPIDKEIKSPRAGGMDLLKPIGQPIEKETEWKVDHQLELWGMGMTNGRKKRMDEKDNEELGM